MDRRQFSKMTVFGLAGSGVVAPARPLSSMALPRDLAMAPLEMKWSEGHRMPRGKAGDATGLLKENRGRAGRTFWDAGKKCWSRGPS